MHVQISSEQSVRCKEIPQTIRDSKVDPSLFVSAMNDLQ